MSETKGMNQKNSAAVLASANVHVVGADEAGQRLDKFLAARLEGVSRSRVQALVRDGQVVCVPGTDDLADNAPNAGMQVVDPAKKVVVGQHFLVTIPPPTPARPAY